MMSSMRLRPYWRKTRWSSMNNPGLIRVQPSWLRKLVWVWCREASYGMHKRFHCAQWLTLNLFRIACGNRCKASNSHIGSFLICCSPLFVVHHSLVRSHVRRVEIEREGVASNATASRGIRVVATISVTILSSQGDLRPVWVVVSNRIHLAFFVCETADVEGERSVRMLKF